MPNEAKGWPAEALGRLVDLYTAWGRPAEAARWRTELNATAEKIPASRVADEKP